MQGSRILINEFVAPKRSEVSAQGVLVHVQGLGTERIAGLVANDVILGEEHVQIVIAAGAVAGVIGFGSHGEQAGIRIETHAHTHVHGRRLREDARGGGAPG